MNHAARNEAQSIPTRKDSLVKGENGVARMSWLNTGHKHADNTLRDFFLDNDPFHRQGCLIASVQEDDHGTRTVRFR